MWPFNTDERLRKRVKALETRLSEAEDANTTLATTVRNNATSAQRQLDALESWLRKVSGVVHGQKGAADSAAKTVPAKDIDKMSKAELRQHLGITPGRVWTPKTTTEDATHED